jgi:hypothetical protein
MKLMFTVMFLLSTWASAAELINGRGTGLIYNKAEPKHGRVYVAMNDCDNLPEEFDLRDLGVVPPVKDQGACGSCWSFSKTASLESAHALANGEMLNLSEQEMVSCDTQSYGCQGGFLSDFNYQITRGQGLEADFPYEARDARCKAIPSKAKGERFVYVGSPERSPTEKEVMCALFVGKTIPWTIVAAEGQWGQAPARDDGIMQNCRARNINHAVGLVGWKKIAGKVYFKVRNSWGTDWGSTAGRPGAERGYTLAAHKCNLLNTEVAYIVTDQTCKPPLLDVPAVITVAKNQDAAVTLPEPEAGITYVWYDGRRRIGVGTTIFVNQDRPHTYKVVAKNACGKSEALIKVEVKL